MPVSSGGVLTSFAQCDAHPAGCGDANVKKMAGISVELTEKDPKRKRLKTPVWLFGKCFAIISVPLESKELHKC